MVKPLTDAELADALSGLPRWRLQDGKLHRAFRFADFAAAFAFMLRVAEVAESMNHHPEWFNVYATVEVWLTTHDAGGVSARDLELARAMDLLAA